MKSTINKVLLEKYSQPRQSHLIFLDRWAITLAPTVANHLSTEFAGPAWPVDLIPVVGIDSVEMRCSPYEVSSFS